jgi:hypothetical protein
VSLGRPFFMAFLTIGGKRSQPTATAFAYLSRFPAVSHLPAVASACDRWAP